MGRFVGLFLKSIYVIHIERFFAPVGKINEIKKACLSQKEMPRISEGKFSFSYLRGWGGGGESIRVE